MAENLRVHSVWPSKYKEKWCFSPKSAFSKTDHHTALKLVPLWSSHLKTSGCTEFDPLNTKKSDVLAQDVLFLETDHHTAMKLYHCKWHGWNLRVHWVWPSNYKGKWCFSPKSVFSEVDDHTALKLVPLWSSDLKTSECTVFGHLNKKKSDVLAQNVFSQKQIIIQLWNLYHCDHHTWKPQSALSLAI